MANFEKTKTKTPSGVFKRAVREKVDKKPKTDAKSIARQRIDSEVFDLYDSVADTAKWVSLINGFVIRIYEALDEDTKARLDPADRAMIEHLSALFKQTPTRLDVQIEQEGPEVLTRMLDRQKQVADIVG